MANDVAMKMIQIFPHVHSIRKYYDREKIESQDFDKCTHCQHP